MADEDAELVLCAVGVAPVSARYIHHHAVIGGASAAVTAVCGGVAWTVPCLEGEVCSVWGARDVNDSIAFYPSPCAILYLPVSMPADPGVGLGRSIHSCIADLRLDVFPLLIVEGGSEDAIQLQSAVGFGLIPRLLELYAIDHGQLDDGEAVLRP